MEAVRFPSLSCIWTMDRVEHLLRMQLFRQLILILLLIHFRVLLLVFQQLEEAIVSIWRHLM